MVIYASDWKGAGTDADPLIPSSVTDPSKPYRSASFPECVFVNDFSPVAREDFAPGGEVVLVAPDIDTVVAKSARDQLKAKFQFTVVPGETLRQSAARRGVHFLPGELGE